MSILIFHVIGKIVATKSETAATAKNKNKMGPKKAAPAKKKGDNNPENGGELTPEEKAKMFMLTCQALQLQLG